MTFPFTMDPSRSAAISLSAAVLIVCALSGSELTAQVARAKPPPTATTFKELAPGLLFRPVFSSRVPDGGTIELWDLLTGPGVQSDSTRLPGAAVLEVRGGNGRIVVDGKPQDVRPGTMVAVPDGATVACLNDREDHGLAIRAVITRRPTRRPS
jgi:hypothetical protein